MTESTSIAWKDIGIVTGIHSAVAFVCFIIFTILRSRNYTRKYYAPKLFDKQQKRKPARLPTSYLGWIWPVLNYNEEYHPDKGFGIVDISGLDLAVYLRVIKLGINLSLCLAFFCLPILVPLHITSDGLKTQILDDARHNANIYKFQSAKNRSEDGLVAKIDVKLCRFDGMSNRTALTSEDIDKTYMTNVMKYTSEKPNDRLWAHLILSYVVVLIIIYWLQKFNLDISNLRVKFLATVPRGGPSHTALITDIPGVKAGTVIHTINKAMNSTVLRVAPKSVQSKVNNVLEDTADAAAKGVGAFGSKAVALLDEEDVEFNDAKMGAAQKALQEAVADPWKAAADYLENGGDFRGLVTSEMETVFPGKVVAVNPVYNEEDLQPVYAKYEKVKSQLEDLVDDYMGKIKQERDASKIKKRETAVLGPMYGSWGIERYGKTKRVKVDSLDFLCEYLNEVKRQVKEAEEPAYNDPTCSAFVTFKDRVSQTAASTSLICQSEMVWRGQPAPGPEEVVWTNLSLRFWEKNLRNLAMWALFIAIVLFFTIVCAFLQGLIVGPLTKKPAMKKVTNLPVVGAVIQGILPTIVLKIFLAILPMILAIMQRFAGAVSTSEVDFGVVTKFYWFQYATVFLSAVVGGTLLSQATAIANGGDIGSIVQNLFNAVPTKASFFINFILLQGLAAKSISLLRAVGLVLFFVFSKLAATDRAKTRLWADQRTSMGTAVADHTIVMLLMITFSVAAPVILAFGFLYFLITSITERYQMIYVYRLPYESGGKMWKVVFTQVMVAAYTFLITMSFLMGAKGFPYTPIIIPAFFILVLFHAQTLKMFTRPWVVMSLRSAALLDNVEQKAGLEVTGEELEGIRETYLSPAFKVKESEHQKVLDEADIVRKFFNGEIEYHDVPFDADDVPEASL